MKLSTVCQLQVNKSLRAKDWSSAMIWFDEMVKMCLEENPAIKEFYDESPMNTENTQTLRCPAGIETLLWYHCRGEPIHESPVETEYTKLLEKEGMIYRNEDSGSGYSTTPRGAYMVETLGNIPFPDFTHKL